MNDDEMKAQGIDKSSNNDSSSDGNRKLSGTEHEDGSDILVPAQEYEDLKAIRQLAVYSLSFWRDEFKHHVKRRRKVFHEPFILEARSIKRFDNCINNIVGRIDRNIPIGFQGVVYFKDRNEIYFDSVEELAVWDDPTKSFPIRVTLLWNYTYIPPEISIQIPLDYQILIDYETEPDTDKVMQLSIEEEVVLDIQGPHLDWMRSASEVLNEAIFATRMPWWWRGLRVVLTRLKPFIDNGAYFLSIALIWIFWGVFDNPHQQNILEKILNSKDVAEKLDIYFRDIYAPYSQFYIGFVLIGFLFAGIVYLLMVICYRYLTPPSIISIGINGRKRASIILVYSVIYMLVIGGIIGAIFDKFI